VKRAFHLSAIVVLAAVVSLPAAGAERPRLPEAAPAPIPQEAVEPPPVIEEVSPERLSSAAPFPVGWEDDVYCAGWIGSENEPVTARIVAAEYEDSREMLGVGDVVYTDVGAQSGLEPGQVFWVLRPAHEVYKYGSFTDVVGRFYRTPGRVKVVCVQEGTAILEFTESCEPAYIGDLLVPFEPIPIPLVRATAPLTQCDRPSGKVTGRIVETKDRATPIGTDSVVFLDLGEGDGLFPGDFLTIFRNRNEGGSIRTLLGEAAVLWTKGRTCVAKVTSMVDSMRVGDFVELK
jgi:hypothetical protein